MANESLMKSVGVHAPSEKQGHLGDLHKKTDAELRELLSRQEAIVKKQRHLLQKLPDKGGKLMNMIDKLRAVLAEREQKMDDTANLFEHLAITADERNQMRTMAMNDSGEVEPLGQIVNAESSKIVIDEREEEAHHVNAYERVMSRKADHEKPTHFVPKCTMKAHSIHELGENAVKDIEKEGLKRMQSKPQVKQAHKTLQQQPKAEGQVLKYRYDESLEHDVYAGKGKHPKAVCIDLTESMRLQKLQKQNIEKVQIEEARRKLAGRFKVMMDSFNPEGASMSGYREPQEFREEEEDSNSDDEEICDLD